MSYLWLFSIHAFISTFTFGGGYVVIAMIEKYFVEQKQLFTKAELLEMAAVAQSSPGAIAINLAVLSGYYLHQKKGAFVACLGSLLPPLLIISLLSLSYTYLIHQEVLRSILKGMEAGAATLIVDLLIDMAKTLFQEQPWQLSLLIPITFIACFFFSIPVLLMILCGASYCLFASSRIRL